MTATSQRYFYAKNLSVGYANTTVLHNLNLTLDQAGVTAILGPNGAGKTTLVNCALGLIQPSSGQLTLMGNKTGSTVNRQTTGVMLQDTDLPDLLTPSELIELFASYYPAPRPLDQIVTLCNIGEFKDTRYKKLSGGQKRRVQFALAIVGSPKMIFLDEPTTGLDVQARQTMWQVIRQLTAEKCHIVLTTHYLEEAEALADHLVVLAHGRVVADAPASELLSTLSGSVIRCTTDLSDQQLASLPGFVSLQRKGRLVEMVTRSATHYLRQLIELDNNLDELSVTKPSLEQVFLELTQDTGITS